MSGERLEERYADDLERRRESRERYEDDNETALIEKRRERMITADVRNEVKQTLGL